MAGLAPLVGALAMIVPPGIVLLGIATAFARLSEHLWVHAALNGVGAAAIGLTGAMGVRATHRSATGAWPALMVGAIFAAVGLLHWPLVPVVAVLAPVSVGMAAWQEASARAP